MEEYIKLMEEYIKLLKNHDWYYQYAEGNAYYRGRENQEKIDRIAKEIDKDLFIYKQYRL